PLPKQNIDTGLGLERGAMLLQGVESIFDTDGYQLIMDWVAKESGVAYGSSEEATKAHRVLADHGRAMTFLAADGIAPANEGRGYVLRRIIRRAVQHGARIGLESPFVARLSDIVIEQMREPYPELAEHRDEIHRVLTAEEERVSVRLPRRVRRLREDRRADAGRGCRAGRGRALPRQAARVAVLSGRRRSGQRRRCRRGRRRPSLRGARGVPVRTGPGAAARGRPVRA